ncbi:hypothetical protein GCM10009804_39590 [Kribbella hippodromi]|uniref:Uncharacterized protein n=1 Tax=Kribbella hippodromi TaxID=434347 RepID=A0ABP4PL81_9ACTN
MADEAAYAQHVEAIATAMASTRGLLDALSDDLDPTKLGAALGRRLDDATQLGAVTGLLQLEGEARNAYAARGGEDVETRARRDDKIAAADAAVRTSYSSAQETAANLGKILGQVRDRLAADDQQLKETVDGLDKGLDQLNQLEQLTGRKGAASRQLGEGLVELKRAAENAREELESAGKELGQARRAVSDLAKTQQQAGGNAHSRAVTDASVDAQRGIRSARGAVQSLHETLSRGEGRRSETVELAITMANTAAEAARKAAEQPAPENTGPAGGPETSRIPQTAAPQEVAGTRLETSRFEAAAPQAVSGSRLESSQFEAAGQQAAAPQAAAPVSRITELLAPPPQAAEQATAPQAAQPSAAQPQAAQPQAAQPQAAQPPAAEVQAAAVEGDPELAASFRAAGYSASKFGPATAAQSPATAAQSPATAAQSPVDPRVAWASGQPMGENSMGAKEYRPESGTQGRDNHRDSR